MATTYQDFTVAAPVGGGGTLPLSVTLEALDSAHFTMTLNGAAYALFVVTGATGAWTVTCTGPLSVGDILRVVRTTPATKAGRMVVFTDGAALDQSALNTALLQQLYITQENEERNTVGRCLAIVKATGGSAITLFTGATWHADGTTELPLEALTDAWNNDGGDVTVDTTMDQFTLSAGTWRITIEASANNTGGTLIPWAVAVYSATPATALKLPNVTDPTVGMVSVFSGAGSFNGGAASKTFILALTASSACEIHAASSAGTLTVDEVQVVLEKLSD